MQEGKEISGHARVPFSLMFKGPRAKDIYNQGIYTIIDKDDRKIDLFMIPRAPDAEGIYYEVIVN